MRTQREWEAVLAAFFFFFLQCCFGLWPQFMPCGSAEVVVWLQFSVAVFPPLHRL